LASDSAGTANLKGYDMSSDVTLSAGVRANLLSLQNTAQLMQTTQNRLATGKRVNSALDNPLNFFTSKSLGARANDLSG
jgi:flagellin-like hook-associated protein FlgL